MSHNLTQPEEIDYILMAMAGHDDMEVDTSIPDAERYELAMACLL
jgi:hypothetical protein